MHKVGVSQTFSIIWHNLWTCVCIICGGNQDINYAKCIQMQKSLESEDQSIPRKTNFWQMYFQTTLGRWRTFDQSDKKKMWSKKNPQHGRHTSQYQALQCVPGIRFPLFPWLFWPHRFLQGASRHGNAYQSIVLFARPSKREDDLGTKECIYLFALRDEGDERRVGDDTFKVFFFFCERQKIGRRNKFWKQACGAPGGCKWRHSSSHVCAALRCPHLRQTHVVLIRRIRTDSFALSASPSPPTNPSRVSSSIPSVLPLLPFLHLWQQSSFLSQYIFPFLYFSYPLPTYFLRRFTFLLSSFFPSLCLLNTPAICVPVIHSILKSLKYFPTGASQLCHCRMYFFSSALPLTSCCFERVMPKTSLFSRDVKVCFINGLSCILNREGSEKHTVCFCNYPGTWKVQIWSR